MADTPQGETVTPQAPSNEPSNTPAPVVDNSSADVEAAKKEAEQARMRANQLENELKKIRDDQAAAKQKQLEEKEEFKTLYEQTQSQLDELKRSQADSEHQAELATATDNVFKDYPANVVELAKTAGLRLSDDSEGAVNALKEKLEVFKKQVTPSATPSANNPRTTTPQEASREELLQRMRGGNKEASLAYIRDIPAVKKWKELNAQGLA